MVSYYNFKDTIFLSVLCGLASEVFVSIELPYIILIFLIIIDTVTGVIKAIRNKKFGSAGLKRFLFKVVTYSLAIFVVRLLEISFKELFITTTLSQVIIAFLNIQEVVSILENLAAVGVPISSSFIKVLLKQIKIDGIFDAMSNNKDVEKDILEIDEIIKYRVSIFTDENIKKILDIKFKMWKQLLLKINLDIKDTETSSELIYYKVMSSVEMCIEETETKWKENNIPNECINNFNILHQPRIEDWLLKIKKICYADETAVFKKEQLAENLKIILYQTLLDTQKGNSSEMMP